MCVCLFWVYVCVFFSSMCLCVFWVCVCACFEYVCVFILSMCVCLFQVRVCVCFEYVCEFVSSMCVCSFCVRLSDCMWLCVCLSVCVVCLGVSVCLYLYVGSYNSGQSTLTGVLVRIRGQNLPVPIKMYTQCVNVRLTILSSEIYLFSNEIWSDMVFDQLKLWHLFIYDIHFILLISQFEYVIKDRKKL